MERLNNDYLDSETIARAEHRHRYQWASGYASGDVCDLACGYGYGAEVLAANSSITSYVGIDASDEAIAQANQQFSRSGRRYMVASATSVPLGDQSVDTIVSLETLEHLQDPALAVREFKRILRPEGVVVGSVPSKYFDDRAEEVYGKNAYHVTRFTHDKLAALLSTYFSTVRIYYSALEVVTHIGTLVEGRPAQFEKAAVLRERPDEEVGGSFHFVATNRDWPEIDAAHENRMLFCMGLTDLDSVRVVPLRKLVDQNEQLVLLKDANFRQAEELILQRDSQLAQAERIVQQRDLELEILRQRNEDLAAIPRFLRWILKGRRRGSYKNSRGS